MAPAADGPTDLHAATIGVDEPCSLRRQVQQGRPRFRFQPPGSARDCREQTNCSPEL